MQGGGLARSPMPGNVFTEDSHHWSGCLCETHASEIKAEIKHLNCKKEKKYNYQGLYYMLIYTSYYPKLRHMTTPEPIIAKRDGISLCPLNSDIWHKHRVDKWFYHLQGSGNTKEADLMEECESYSTHSIMLGMIA